MSICGSDVAAAFSAAHLERDRGSGLWVDKTIGDLARGWAATCPDQSAFLNERSRSTYQEILGDAEALSFMFHEIGLRKGDVISFQLPNWLEAAIINLAGALSGLVVNPIVPIYRDSEVKYMLADSGSRAFIYTSSFRNYDYAAMLRRIEGDLPRLAYKIAVRSPAENTRYEDLVDAGRGQSFPAPSICADDTKLLLYTSGTTGRPKAVMHSHNSLARVEQVTFSRWGLKAGDAFLMPSPITHISGYTNGLEQPFVSGTRTLLMETWNAAEAARLIEQFGICGTVAATPFLQELAETVRASGKRLETFRMFACGGASVPAELIRKANTAFAQPCAFRMYGSTETPAVTIGFPPSTEPELAASTDGLPVDYAVRVVDDQGADVPPGTEGEILARGPAMFTGYLDENDTRDALTEDGYFLSGDIGFIDGNGAVVITGRKKDLIIRGGENISAKEIEDVLAEHPEIREAAVVAMPHLRLGEGICAYIILNRESTLSARDVIDFLDCAGLAKQKIPEWVEFVDDLPRTLSGKIRKDVLRGMIAEKKRL